MQREESRAEAGGAGEPVLQVRSLRWSGGGRAALDSADLELLAGEGLVLTAGEADPSTDLFHLAAGLGSPDAGSIRVCGLDPVQEPGRAKQRVGYLPDGCDAPRWMRAQDYFDHLALHYPEWNEDLVEDLCDDWGVHPSERFSAAGRDQVQRAQLVACLAYKPALLLLGPPFVAGGAIFSAPVLASLAEYRSRGGAMVVRDAGGHRMERAACWVEGRLYEGERLRA